MTPPPPAELCYSQQPGSSSTNAGGSAEAVSASICSSNKLFNEGLGSRCPANRVTEGLCRKVGFLFPSLASVTEAQLGTPCHLDGAGQARLGHLDVLQHCCHTRMKHHCATELVEVTEGSPSILTGQEKDISYQTWVFCWGLSSVRG